MFSAWSTDPLQFNGGGALTQQPQPHVFPFSDRQMRCVGCASDHSVRVHYGAPSCHGCKAFFRRSVFEGRTYECSSRNTCDVTPAYRNRCRACRFRNCLSGGMNAKLVREERFKTSMRNGNSSQPSSIPGNSPKSETEFSMNVKPEPVDHLEEELTMVNFLSELERRMDMLQDPGDCNVQDEVSHWGTHFFYNLGLQNPQFVIQRHAITWQCQRVMTPRDMYFGWYRAFVLLADWAMGLPEFRMLPLADQTLLFKENFSAFGWMTYAYRCYEYGGIDLGIPLGNGAYIPYLPDHQALLERKWAESYGVVCKNVMEHVVHNMRDLSWTFEEFCLLKTIALFQQDCRLSVQATLLCTRMRERLIKALNVIVDMKFPHLTSAQKMSRVSHQMLLMPTFSNIGRMEADMLRNMGSPDMNMSGVPMVICNSVNPKF